jgi:hypothetical protein
MDERLLAGQTEEYRAWHAEAHRNIAHTYYRQERYDKANAHAQLAIAGWPNTSAAAEAQLLLDQIARKEEAQEGGR